MAEIIEFDQEVTLPQADHTTYLSKATYSAIKAMEAPVWDANNNTLFPANKISVEWKWYRPFRLIISF
jgi:hypothetical protein